MSFFGIIAPLYLAGLAALAIPIVLHLIRRTPKGRVSFSTLMFLESSPPRMTRRSRLDNWWLLLLRALAIALIVIAFCRPFFRWSAEQASQVANGRRLAILVDRSASMHRGDLWQQTIDQVDATLADLQPTDRASLIAFDRRAEVLVGFDAVQGDDSGDSLQTLIRDQVRATGPTWNATDIGAALISACDLLEEQKTTEGNGQQNRLQVVLISDLQQGGDLSALQSFEWPEDVVVSVRQIADLSADNATLRILTNRSSEDAAEETSPESPADGSDEKFVRVLVSNGSESDSDEFAVRWDDGEPINVQVPPGESRVVRMKQKDSADHDSQATPSGTVRLSGDDHDFDNRFYLAMADQPGRHVEFLGEMENGVSEDDVSEDDAAENGERTGDKAANDEVKFAKESGLLFYLQNLFSGERDSVTSVDADSLLTDSRLPDLLVIAADASRATNRVQDYVNRGGRVLLVATSADMQSTFQQLLLPESNEDASNGAGSDAIKMTEADVDRFALLGNVDFGHPLFAPFADPRYSDFTDSHFWKYRRLEIPDPASGLQVIAKFDSGDPALLYRSPGNGEIFAMTSGWNPADSQLAVSTKFVPLMLAMAGRDAGDSSQPSYVVGERIRLNADDFGSPQISGELRLLAPNGDERLLKTDERGNCRFVPNMPGVYQIQTDEDSKTDIGSVLSTTQWIAVNIDADESRIQPIDTHQLQQLQVQMGRQESSTELVRRQQQLRSIELEQSQSLWSKLILAAMGLLFAETIAAGWLARRQNSHASSTGAA